METPEKTATAWAVSVLNLPEGTIPTATPISRGGSDRSFYRLRWDSGSALLMIYHSERRENAFFAPIGFFLRAIGVAVPEIYGHDPGQCFLVMEDLGDDDLWSCREVSWDIRRHLYEKTLDVISRLHAYPLAAFPETTVPLMDGFDATLYRWERDYFREHFVAGVCRIHLSPMEDSLLEQELGALALRLDSAPQALIHRDFQSQNVMIRDGEPVLIDFQGMRRGNPLYDLASLLYDPYVSMTQEEREALIQYYYDASGQTASWDRFLENVRSGAAQRLMQALGAYGFLGLVKGRRQFLGHIAAGLRHLEEATRDAGSLSLLNGLARQCQQTLNEKGHASASQA